MYKYDFHCHSNYSDGALPPDILAELAEEKGMSALVLTDHFLGAKLVDEIEEVMALKTNIPIICGTELLVGQNEFLIFGEKALELLAQNDYKRFAFEVSSTKHEVEVLSELYDAGAGIVACHPTSVFLMIAHAYDECINGVEVLYRGTESSLTSNSQDAKKVANKFGKVQIFSTDSHSDNVGECYTEVETELKTTDDIANWLRKSSEK